MSSSETRLDFEKWIKDRNAALGNGEPDLCFGEQLNRYKCAPIQFAYESWMACAAGKGSPHLRLRKPVKLHEVEEETDFPPNYARGFNDGAGAVIRLNAGLVEAIEKLNSAKPKEDVDFLATALKDLLQYAEREICTHEETHRGGAIWEICDSCGQKWADDRGGKPEFKWPDEIEGARAAVDKWSRKQ